MRAYINAFLTILGLIFAVSLSELVANAIFPALAEKTLIKKIVEWPK